MDFFFFVKKKKIFSQKARSYTAQKMKFSIRDFFNKCDQMLPVLNVWFGAEMPKHHYKYYISNHKLQSNLKF